MKDKGADRGVLVISLLFGLFDSRGSSYFLHWIDNTRSTHLKRACHGTREWLIFEYQMSSDLSVTTNIFLLKPKCSRKIWSRTCYQLRGSGSGRNRNFSARFRSGSVIWSSDPYLVPDSFCRRKNMYNFFTVGLLYLQHGLRTSTIQHF